MLTPDHILTFDAFWSVNYQWNPEGEEWSRDILRDAHIITAQDVMTNLSVMVFGRHHLDRISRRARAGNTKPIKTRMVRVMLDIESPDMRCLLMVVCALKGQHDMDPEEFQDVYNSLACLRTKTIDPSGL